MSEWVPVCETEGAQPVEIETDDDGTMPLSSITAHFPGTTTLKFRAPVRLDFSLFLSVFYDVIRLTQLLRAGLPTEV